MRSVSHLYSKTLNRSRVPELDPLMEQLDSADFLDDFKLYSDDLFRFYESLDATVKKDKFGSSKWYNEDVFFEIRFYIFKIDNRAKITAAAAGTVPNKMAQEADARKAYIYKYILIKFHLPTGCFIQININ